ncbi:MAG: nuclear transport factor 2 family protein [Ktedonobacterales bacterium]
MSNQPTTSVADAATVRRAIESGEEATLVGLYTDDAELRIVDQTRPPSKPTVIRGRAEIASYYHDVCSRAMTHAVDEVVDGGNGLAFTEDCRYPDGMRVVSANLLALRDGKIAHHTLVQAWDE